MRSRTLGLELVLVAAAVAFLFPVYVLLVLSLKDPQEIAAATLGPPRHLELANYSTAWTEAKLGAALLSSTVITVASVLAVVALGSLCAYFLARTRARLSYTLYIVFLVGIILPFQLGLVPLYALAREAGLLGTYAGVVAVYTGLQLPFTVFLYTGFLRALPREYGEAALVDGATHLQSFARVTFPLLRPITATVIVLNALFVWNDFLIPLLYLGGTSRETVPVVVFGFVGQYGARWGPIFAAIVLAMAPILAVFLVLQRYVLKGLERGLKG